MTPEYEFVATSTTVPGPVLLKVTLLPVLPPLIAPASVNVSLALLTLKFAVLLGEMAMVPLYVFVPLVSLKIAPLFMVNAFWIFNPLPAIANVPLPPMVAVALVMPRLALSVNFNVPVLMLVVVVYVLAPSVNVPLPCFVNEAILLIGPILLLLPALLTVNANPPPATPVAAKMSPLDEVSCEAAASVIVLPKV